MQIKMDLKNIQQSSLAGVDQWTECQPANQKGHQFDSHSGNMPGFQARSPVASTQEATTH